MQREPVTVWLLPSNQDLTEDVLDLLDEGERAQNARFVRRSDRTAFALTRAALRCLLSAEIGSPPRQIRLVSNAWGKPSLAETHGGRHLDFSVSHTADLSTIAISSHGRAGVDLERCRPIPEKIRIAANVFGEAVARKLDLLPDDQQNDAFLRLWTAGEACAKAMGLGLAGMGERLPVGLSSSGIPEMEIGPGSSARTDDRFALLPLDLPHGYIGCVVVETNDPGPQRICVPERTSVYDLIASAC